MKRAKGTVNVKGANAPSISMTPVARHSNAPPASMRRRLPQHKEPDCPATILFRYSDRQTIRIYEASGEGQLYRLFLQGTTRFRFVLRAHETGDRAAPPQETSLSPLCARAERVCPPKKVTQTAYSLPGNARSVLSGLVIRDVVPLQIDLCRIDRLIGCCASLHAYTADTAIMAIPGTPNPPAFGLFDVDRIADTRFRVIQFLNFDGCHHTYLLRLLVEAPTKSPACPGTKSEWCEVKCDLNWIPCTKR